MPFLNCLDVIIASIDRYERREASDDEAIKRNSLSENPPGECGAAGGAPNSRAGLLHVREHSDNGLSLVTTSNSGLSLA